jgi:hypothetical protein
MSDKPIILIGDDKGNELPFVVFKALTIDEMDYCALTPLVAPDGVQLEIMLVTIDYDFATDTYSVEPIEDEAILDKAEALLRQS